MRLCDRSQPSVVDILRKRLASWFEAAVYFPNMAHFRVQSPDTGRKPYHPL